MRLSNAEVTLIRDKATKRRKGKVTGVTTEVRPSITGISLTMDERQKVVDIMKRLRCPSITHTIRLLILDAHEMMYKENSSVKGDESKESSG